MRPPILLLSLTALPLAPLDAQGPVRLPARFVADRVFVLGITSKGDTLGFYTDTGGGANMLDPAVARRLGLPLDSVIQGGDTIRLSPWPVPAGPGTLPAPSAVAPFDGKLMLRPMQPGLGEHGFLGRTWFATRVWRFDYPKGELWLLPAETSPRAGSHTVPLGFQVDSAGQRTTHFPRIEAVVDNDTLQFLFDTGATLFPADSARPLLGDPREPAIGASFITDEVFRRWRSRHPDWPVVQRGERTTGAALIRAANVRVAGQDTGPVWFTVRPDRSFHQFMAQWMDRKLDGALGGSAFRNFRITIDYPNATATFEREE